MGDEPLTIFQQLKADACKASNSYTRSGLLQLARQFSGDLVEPRYPEQDLISGINLSTTSVLLQGYLIAKITGQDDAAARVEELFTFGKD